MKTCAFDGSKLCHGGPAHKESGGIYRTSRHRLSFRLYSLDVDVRTDRATGRSCMPVSLHFNLTCGWRDSRWRSNSLAHCTIDQRQAVELKTNVRTDIV